MKKSLKLLISLFLCTSCSSIDKSMIYSGLAGSIMGGFAGRYLSPDRESDKFNIILGATIGGAVGGGVGAYFFKQDPDNRSMKTMLAPVNDKSTSRENFEIGSPISEKFYTVTPDTSTIPDHLKDKIKKQIIVEKIMPERIINGEGGKTTLIPETKVIEINYQ